MRFPANLFPILIVALLAGCASNPRRSSTATVWEDINSVVPPAPVFPVAGPVESTATNSAKPVVQNPTAPAPVAVTETWVPLQRWVRTHNLGALVRLGSSPVPTFALQSTNGNFVLRTGSQLGQWDGLEVRLGFAPQLIDDQPFVHALDLIKTIQPLVQGESILWTSSTPVIVIDPGHGGENPGTRSVLGSRYEKEFTLDWALRLQAVLAAHNVKSYLTRSNDTDLALSNRVAFAADRKADVFISLHFNSAAPNEVESGLETYCLTPVGMPSSLTRGFADEISQTFPNNTFDTQNLVLALRIHRALLQINGHHDRGIRRARFPGVLRGQQRASVLVEGGYLSNPQEARLIADPAYRQKLAEAVAGALLRGSNGATGVVALNTQTQTSEPKTGIALDNGPVFPIGTNPVSTDEPAKEHGAGVHQVPSP